MSRFLPKRSYGAADETLSSSLLPGISYEHVFCSDTVLSAVNTLLHSTLEISFWHIFLPCFTSKINKVPEILNDKLTYVKWCQS